MSRSKSVKDKNHSIAYAFYLELKLFSKWLWNKSAAILLVAFISAILVLPDVFIYKDLIDKSSKSNMLGYLISIPGITIIFICLIGLLLAAEYDFCYNPDKSTGVTEAQKERFSNMVVSLTVITSIVLSIVVYLLYGQEFGKWLVDTPLNNNGSPDFLTGEPLAFMIISCVVFIVMPILGLFFKRVAQWFVDVRKDGQVDKTLAKIAAYDKKVPSLW